MKSIQKPTKTSLSSSITHPYTESAKELASDLNLLRKKS